MTGKTHLAVGTAVTLCVTRPDTLSSLLICVGVSLVGSVISDIDVKTSNSRRQLNWIMGCATAIILVAIFVEYQWNIGLFQNVWKSKTIARIVCCFLVFLAICQFGKHQPHRTFMHSLLACLILSQTVHLAFPNVSIYFAISMLSHIFLDMFNKKDVSLLYPMHGGISFKLCTASGIVNKLLFGVGIALSVAVSIQLLMQMSFWNR